MQKTALIIGAGGQDGILLSELLKTKNYRLVLVFKDQLNMSDKFEIEEFIVNNMSDEIYYFASENPSSQDEESSSIKSFNTNLIFLINLFEAVINLKIQTKIFYASTSHIFSGNQSLNQTEESIAEPISLYGLTKFYATHACGYYRKNKNIYISTGILFNHESKYRKESFVSKKITLGIKKILNKEISKLELGDIDIQIDWGYAPDFVEAMYKIMQLKYSSDFIISTNETHSLREFLDIAFSHVGLNYLDYININNSIVKRTNNHKIGNNSKLIKSINWSPSVNFKQMVEKLVDDELFN
jgi:GDPmannose 4,6-dehydratase